MPEFFADAPTQVHEAVEMLLKTKFQSERFAHHYKIHGGVEFLQGIANFFADPEKAIWLLKETGVENMADVWPVLAARLRQAGRHKQPHPQFLFITYPQGSRSISRAKFGCCKENYGLANGAAQSAICSHGQQRQNPKQPTAKAKPECQGLGFFERKRLISHATTTELITRKHKINA